MRYIVGIIGNGILYSNTNSDNFFGYTNSDFVGNMDDKNTLGNVFHLGLGMITWEPKKPITVILLSVVCGSNNNNFVKQFYCVEYGVLNNNDQRGPIIVYCGINIAVILLKNHVFY